MARYFIRTSKVKGEATLYTQYQRHGKNIRINTFLKVDILKWSNNPNLFLNCEQEDTMRYNRFLTELDVPRTSLRDKLAMMDKFLVSAGKDVGKDEIQKGIKDIAAMEKRQRDEKAKEIERKQQEEQEQRRREDVTVYAHEFLEEIKNGNRKTKANETYSANTIKLWHTFIGLLDEFTNTHPLSWATMNKADVDAFKNFLEKKGYLKKTVNKYFFCLRALVGYSYDADIHDNAKAKTLFSTKDATKKEKATEIVLTADEVNALYDAHLTGNKDIARDLFLCGLFTAQRYSDYVRIERGWFGTTKKGNEVIRFQQVKTKKDMTIPVLDKRLHKVCEKYDYHLPEMSNVLINRYIKEIFEDIAKTVPTLNKDVATVLTLRERTMEQRGDITYKRDSDGNIVKPRWAMVNSHTARRTTITELYRSRRFTLKQIMAISGHSSIAMLENYIKLSEEEIADSVADALGDDGLF